MDSEGKGPKPPEKGKVLKFERPEEPLQQPVKPLIDQPTAPPVSEDDTLVELGDEKYRRAHQRMQEKFRKADEAVAGFSEMAKKNGGTLSANIQETFRNAAIEQHAQMTDGNKEKAARFLDTQLLTERAQADMSVEEYVRLRVTPGDETEEILEAAYEQAKKKYGSLYPAADPHMFNPTLQERRAMQAQREAFDQPAPETQPASTSFLQRIRNILRRNI